MAAALTSIFSFDGARVRDDYLSAEQFMRHCDCILSSKPLAKRPHSHPVDFSPGRILYAKLDDYVGNFDSFRGQRNRVVLVSSESDIAITRRRIRQKPSQVHHWFATDVVEPGPGVSGLPLGLANSYCGVTLKAPLLANRSRPLSERPSWLYVNFRPETSPSVRAPIMEHFADLADAKWLTVRRSTLDLGTFLDELTSHRFVICPEGSGVESHRMWEALYSRTIPIVTRNPALEPFADLPILAVDDFRMVTREFLQTEYQRMTARKWNHELMFLPWWGERFREESKAARRANQGRLSTMEYFCERVRHRFRSVLQRFR
ncbi:MAG TPA: hypothetical protein VIS96_13100 [Terrimicrobiaceae bacterium]